MKDLPSYSLKQLLSFIWQFIKPHRFLFFLICFVSLSWSIDATVWPYLLRIVTDILTSYESNRESVWVTLKIPVLFGIALWLVLELGFRMQGFLLARTLPRLEADIRMKMFDHVQRHSPRYFNQRYAGSLSNKITDMTTNVTLILQQLLSTFFPAITAFILSTLFFFQLNFIFSSILVIWILLHFSLCFIFLKKCETLELVHSESRSTLLGKIVDSFGNNFAVNLFFRFKFEKTRMRTFQEDERKKNYMAKRQVEVMRTTLALSTLLIGGFLINGLMLYLWAKGKLTTGEIIQIFNTSSNVTMFMWITSFELPALLQSMGIAKQALSIMNDPPDILDAPGSKPLEVQKGEIIFENVCFYYGEKKLFENKNIKIKGGEKVGLVGYSGAGKSTFVNLILRFYPIEKGRILIDGQDISLATLESLRSQVSLIPQDPHLFHRSIYENILYGRTDATMEEVMAAIKFANCEQLVEKLPNGIHSLIGEKGSRLSGGERQRIAIARAFLSKAPILILDEATSALDSITEKYIQDSLESLMENRTTLAIAHRLSTLARMDRILVFDQGKIVEEGTHQELLDKNGLYTNMWKMQAGGFLPAASNLSRKS